MASGKPSAAFTPTTYSGTCHIPVTVTMTASAGVGRTIAKWLLTWGDGTSSVGTGVPMTASHVYTPAAVYRPKLVVTDNLGAMATANARITIRCVSAPIVAPLTVTPPANVTVVSPDGNPVVVTFANATTSGGTAPIVVSSQPASGSLFPVGVTSVAVLATSADGQHAASSFTVTVTFSPPPPVPPPAPTLVLTVPEQVSIVSPDGNPMAVAYPAPTTVGGIPPVAIASRPAPGSVFPIGATSVGVIATSADGQSAQGAFTVAVLTPAPQAPTLTVACPSNQTAHAPTSNPIAVTFPDPVVAGGVAPIAVSYDQPSGSLFPVGVTTVTATATSSDGQTATCTFTVTVLFGSLTVLQPSDFSGQYLGIILLPSGGSDSGQSNHGFGTGALTGRMVGGQTRLTLSGSTPDGGPVYEVTLPAQFAPDYATAQANPSLYRAAVVNDWGGLSNELQTKMFAAVSPNGFYVRGLLHYNGKLLIAFQDKYSGLDFPCIIYAAPQADGQPIGPARGPWPTSAGSKSTGGYLAALPPAFVAAHTPGKPIAYGSPFGSVGASSPWGIISVPGVEPTDSQPLSTPIACGVPLAKFTIDSPQPVPTWVQRAICGYNVAGAGATCAMGSYGPNPSDGFFGPCDYPISGNTLGNARRNQNVVNDYVFGSVWYNGGTKQGVLFFGWLSTVVPGGSYGSDTKSHDWYHANERCCHGQVDGFYTGVTGPHTATRRLVMWIYDQDDFAKVAQGLMSATDLRENTLTPLSPLSGGAILEQPVVGPSGVQSLTQGWIDANNRLFIAENFRDTTTNPYSPLPVVHVFQLPA